MSVSYESVHVPVGKTGKEIGEDWRLRRADLLRRIKQAGGWHNLNISKLAHEEYEVSRSTLYDDREALAEYINESLSETETTLDGWAVYGRAVHRLQEDADTLRSQGEIAKAGKAEKEAARIQRWADEFRRKEGDLEEIFRRIEKIEERQGATR